MPIEMVDMRIGINGLLLGQRPSITIGRDSPEATEHIIKEPKFPRSATNIIFMVTQGSLHNSQVPFCFTSLILVARFLRYGYAMNARSARQQAYLSFAVPVTLLRCNHVGSRPQIARVRPASKADTSNKELATANIPYHAAPLYVDVDVDVDDCSHCPIVFESL